MEFSLQKSFLHYDQKQVELTPNKMSFFEELYVDLKVEQAASYQRIQLSIHPKKAIDLKKVTLEIPFAYQNTDRIFCNGFQSWSESKELGIQDRIPRLRAMARPWLKYFGDEYIEGIQRGKGQLHSWTYSYIRRGTQIYFVGSLNEKTAFTLLQHEPAQRSFRIHQDCHQLHLSHSFPLIDVILTTGTAQEVFDRYFKLMEIPPPSTPKLVGWTSWYHYYTDISEAIILKNLAAFVEQQKAIDIIQIDDGYENKVGDWKSIKKSFPNGMASVARKIHEKGYKAGLWIAPFVCEQDSKLFKQHPEWLLKDATGKPLKVGYTPLWSGWFYALNFYHQGVQDYLTGVLFTMLHKWNFDLLKMDFLYAACIAPPKGKTRGQVMNDAMQFLRKQCGDKWILACGVPLGSAFGLVDYCRIGADIHLKWEHAFLKMLNNRERVSTIVALRTVLSRWQLNGRAFHNDPDVFILRDTANQLSPEQQYTILLINTLLGNLLFTSDYVGDYSPEQWSEWNIIEQWKESTIEGVEMLSKDVYQIRFRNGGDGFSALCNLTTKPTSILLEGKRHPLEATESMVVRSSK